jgi:hypothetical protein
MLQFINNKTAQGISAWLTIVAGVFALLSKLTPEWFGALTVPQAIFVGIASALGLGLALAITLLIGGIAYRLVRPLPTASAETPPGNDGPPPGLTADDVEAIVLGQRLAALEDVEKSLAEIEARLKDSDAAFDKLKFEHDSFRANFDPAIEQAFAPLRDEIKAAQEDLATELRRGASQAEKDQDAFQDRMERWVGQLQRKIRLGLAGVDKGFAAILDRERLLEMARVVTILSDELTGPSFGKPLGHWADWQENAKLFHKAAEDWARLAGKHMEGVVDRVFDTPRSEYKQKWGVKDYGIFPDHDAIDDYKTLCIISRNFHVERKRVDEHMQLAAFAKPSMKVKFDPDDPADADLLSTEPPPEVQNDR